MTATFKTLLALIFVLAQGAALADQAPPATVQDSVQVSAPAPVKDRLAWQRVGSPLQQA